MILLKSGEKFQKFAKKWSKTQGFGKTQGICPKNLNKFSSKLKVPSDLIRLAPYKTFSFFAGRLLLSCAFDQKSNTILLLQLFETLK